MIDYLDLIGVPFAYGGRGPDTYDCYGLVIELFRRQGVSVPDYRSSSDPQIAAMAMESSIAAGVWKNKWTKTEAHLTPAQSLMTPGDVLLLRVVGLPCHVGMVVSKDRFVHTWEGVGGVLTERTSLWQQRILGIYSFNG
jgi:cell wall-associated NlpC family hydrolase